MIEVFLVGATGGLAASTSPSRSIWSGCGAGVATLLISFRRRRALLQRACVCRSARGPVEMAAQPSARGNHQRREV